MRGFAATPIIFIALFLITATLFMQFSSVDKIVAEGINKEIEVSKASANAMKIEAENRTAIYIYAKDLVSQNKTEQEITDSLHNRFGISFIVTKNNSKTIITYTLETNLNNLNKTQTYTETIF